MNQLTLSQMRSIYSAVKLYAPLEIAEISWNGTTLHIHGNNWSFTTLSAWRISSDNGAIFGCYDSDSVERTASLRGLKILSAEPQTSRLRIDPIFYLSNGQYLEIFSTDTYEPWTLYIAGEGMYNGMPTTQSTQTDFVSND